MKKVLILFDKVDENDGMSDSLRQKFAELYDYAKDRGVEFCRSPIEFYNEENKFFTRAQFFNSGKWEWLENVEPDVIYDKTPFYLEEDLMKARKNIAKDFTFLNDLKLSELMSNKWLTYQRFTEFSPKAVLVEKEADLDKIKELNSDKVILKPITGSEGEGIKIFHRDEIEPIEYPFLAQELVEASRGIPGLVKGPHDLRVVVCNEKPIYAFLRIPQQGKLIANLNQGGGVVVVDLGNLLEETFDLLNLVYGKLKNYPQKLYSVDMIFDDNGKSWILEMNSRPGITLEEEEKGRGEVVWDNLIKFLKEI